MATRVLIVDDSALMRRHFQQLFLDAGDFETATAKNGLEAIAVNKEFDPDVITLDINMPEMDGLTALSVIMAEKPKPVIMVSSLTEKGALATFEALALGAVDFVPKPSGTISLSIDDVKQDILDKVRSAARTKVKSASNSATQTNTTQDNSRTAEDSWAVEEGLVVIGVSTGGPSALEAILPKLPPEYPFPILVAQHMPPTFTAAFAHRMDRICALNVVEVDHPMMVEPGTIYIAMGGSDMVLTVRRDQLVALPKPESPDHMWHPSVEVLAESILTHCEPDHVIGVLLTGMGHDGAESFSAIKRGGGRTIAESETSAAVFGMPKELIERKGANVVLPVHKIATQLMYWSRRPEA